jgi:hypothetical protein
MGSRGVASAPGPFAVRFEFSVSNSMLTAIALKGCMYDGRKASETMNRKYSAASTGQHRWRSSYVGNDHVACGLISAVAYEFDRDGQLI